MLPKSSTSTICLIVSLAPGAIAADSQPAQVDAPLQSTWTVDDVLSAKWAGDWKISPGCESAAWVKRTPDKDKGESVGNVFSSSLINNQKIQLTRESDGCSSPKWSSDSKLVTRNIKRANLSVAVMDKTKSLINCSQLRA
jgi:hypothetical protein